MSLKTKGRTSLPPNSSDNKITNDDQCFTSIKLRYGVAR